jgi:hypothetical protein
MLPRASFEEHGPRYHPHSKNPMGDRFVVPTLAKNARMGQPQVVIHGAEAQGWASPPEDAGNFGNYQGDE